MPIYAYKCDSCGYAQDVLQKVSDEPLTVCPACGAGTFRKQVTAAGFQLKGTGWYVTDFRGGGAGAAAGAATSKSDDGAKGGDSATSNSDSAGASTPCGASCACQ